MQNLDWILKMSFARTIESSDDTWLRIQVRLGEGEEHLRHTDINNR